MHNNQHIRDITSNLCDDQVFCIEEQFSLICCMIFGQAAEAESKYPTVKNVAWTKNLKAIITALSYRTKYRSKYLKPGIC